MNPEHGVGPGADGLPPSQGAGLRAVLLHAERDVEAGGQSPRLGVGGQAHEVLRLEDAEEELHRIVGFHIEAPLPTLPRGVEGHGLGRIQDPVGLGGIHHEHSTRTLVQPLPDVARALVAGRSPVQDRHPQPPRAHGGLDDLDGVELGLLQLHRRVAGLADDALAQGAVQIDRSDAHAAQLRVRLSAVAHGIDGQHRVHLDQVELAGVDDELAVHQAQLHPLAALPAVQDHPRQLALAGRAAGEPRDGPVGDVHPLQQLAEGEEPLGAGQLLHQGEGEEPVVLPPVVGLAGQAHLRSGLVAPRPVQRHHPGGRAGGVLDGFVVREAAGGAPQGILGDAQVLAGEASIAHLEVLPPEQGARVAGVGQEPDPRSGSPYGLQPVVQLVVHQRAGHGRAGSGLPAVHVAGQEDLVQAVQLVAAPIRLLSSVTGEVDDHEVLGLHLPRKAIQLVPDVLQGGLGAIPTGREDADAVLRKVEDPLEGVAHQEHVVVGPEELDVVPVVTDVALGLVPLLQTGVFGHSDEEGVQAGFRQRLLSRASGQRESEQGQGVDGCELHGHGIRGEERSGGL